MVTGDPGVHGAHVAEKQEKYTDSGHAIIQQPKMEGLPAWGHLIQPFFV